MSEEEVKSVFENPNWGKNEALIEALKKKKYKPDSSKEDGKKGSEEDNFPYTINYDELNWSKITKMIQKNKSFEIIALGGNLIDTVSNLENTIESENLSCRIYTYGRAASAGATLIGGITGVVGLASVVGMAAHNIATFNPDYEIAKHLVNNKLTVSYKK